MVNPCIPDSWPGFEATVYVHSTRYDIRVESTPGPRAMHSVLDSEAVDCSDDGVYVPLDARSHRLSISLCTGVAEKMNSPEPAV